MRFKKPKVTLAEMDMTPMIDVVFLLIIFFVWTAGFQMVEHVLPSNLTATAGSAAATARGPPRSCAAPRS